MFLSLFGVLLRFNDEREERREYFINNYINKDVFVVLTQEINHDLVGIMSFKVIDHH